MVDEVKEEYYTVAFNIISNVGAAKKLSNGGAFRSQRGRI